MKPAELMIGDWVYDSYHKANATVTTLTRALLWVGLKDNNHWQLKYDEIEPIPLTAEILEHNGFRKFDFERGIEGQHQWAWWIDTMTSVTLWCRELHDNPKEWWMVRIATPISECCIMIDGIHELQHAMRLCKIKKEIEL